MNVLMAHKYYWPKAGAEAYVLRLSRLLEEAGHTVVPFAMAHPNNLPTPYARYFPSEVEFRGPRNLWTDVGRAARVLYSREARVRLDQLLADTPIDVAHVHNIAHQLSPSILAPLARRGIPIVHTAHDYKLLCPVYTFRSQGEVCERCKGGHYWNAALRRCNAGSWPLSVTSAAEATLHRALKSYRRVHVFHAPSLFLLAKMVEHGIPRERIAFVPHFVDAAAYTPAQPSGKRALYAGRLSEEKGLFTLLEAHRRAPGVLLTIAGDGPLRAALEARVAPEQRARLTFAGHLAGEAYETAWREAACLVLPSEWYEVRPMVIHEAMARGRAVVSTRLGTIPELVEHERTGLLVPPGDPDALAAALVALTTDGARAAALGVAGREAVMRLYAPAGHLAAMLDVYAQAARAAGRALPAPRGVAA
jgi:glycosyltransferase involved in cell wall biosynthesis